MGNFRLNMPADDLMIGQSLMSDQEMIGRSLMSDQEMIGTASVFTRATQRRMFATMTAAQIATLERLARNAIEAAESRAAVLANMAQNGLEMGR